MSGQPRITVVTPSHNHAHFIEETIESVVNQGYPNLEYIVLDAGSRDGTVEILERYDDRISFWESKPDDGQSAALRRGFGMATGDILTWLNSDDLLFPNSLQTVADTWTRHGEDLIIAGGCLLFGDDGPHYLHYSSFQDQFDVRQPLPVDRILNLAFRWFPGEFFWQPEVFFPAVAYREAGGVDPEQHLVMDYDLWVRMAIRGTDIAVIKEPLAWYREHAQQKSADRRALSAEMVKTANRHLATGPVRTSRQARNLIGANRAANLKYVREGIKATLLSVRFARKAAHRRRQRSRE